MKPTRLIMPALVALAAVALVWLLFVRLPSRYESTPAPPAAPAAAPSAQGRNIKAQLFYVADDGMSLTAVEREVAFGESAVEQAKAIVGAQIAPAAAPLVSAIPAGTTLRALFITRGGEAYVDLSGELVTGHPGGSTNELLTIRTLVDALTANLPAITAVQLLVDGKELDTLAGHVDLRRPFARKVQ
ncbi:MAG: GerMN domain-containing protein [Candidatus Rokuibacteriota bacterium]